MSASVRPSATYPIESLPPRLLKYMTAKRLAASASSGVPLAAVPRCRARHPPHPSAASTASPATAEDQNLTPVNRDLVDISGGVFRRGLTPVRTPVVRRVAVAARRAAVRCMA